MRVIYCTKKFKTIVSEVAKELEIYILFVNMHACLLFDLSEELFKA